MNPFVPTVIITALISHVIGFAQSAGAEASDRPNIVLIMADDMGYECVGAYGGTSYKTPVLDRLAKDGLQFDHCHSQPICTPSRVQLMTGIYNSRNYVKFGLLDPKATTFGNILKKAGYATCIVGKWQLKGGFAGPGRFGFDEYCLWQLTRRPNRYPNPGLEINGKEVDYKNGEYGPDIVTDYANDFMARHAKKDKPFFLYYPMMLPHWPFEPTPDSAEWNPNARQGDKAEKSGKGVDNKFFADMVTYTDKMVGKVVSKLDELGIRKNTLVLFIGDNGTFTGITSMMGNVAVKGGKGKTIDAGTHVPMIASWPGVVPSGKCQDLVDFSDFLPTLAEIGGATLPKDIQFDGRSFAPQLRDQPGSPREWIYCWYSRNGVRKNASQHVRDRRYKLYATSKFFDVQKDVLEQRPLQTDA
ncbi:MAG: sulfatase-like hydrolase/transferase, partial [Planctomycetes bacterium]|nr:sulfatase-like hydrolase/transferase [Planctomycetota bacterium]